jgi:hypothetical protein
MVLEQNQDARNSGPVGRRGRPLPNRQPNRRPELNEIVPPAPVEETPPAQNFNYSDPGRFGARGYEYQVGDEFNSPGEEPDRATQPEEWAAWKRHAAAWRNFIGGRQQYVNQMIGAGYNPEDLGITPRKEEGRAGYNRLMQPGVIDQLRANSARWMQGSDAEVDPTTGLYVSGGNYYDKQGMQVGQNGRPTGTGFYGMENTRGQFGAQAVPRGVQNYTAPTRMPAPRPTNVPQPPPRPVESSRVSNYGGWGQAFGQGNLQPGFRNRRPRPQFSPYGV